MGYAAKLGGKGKRIKIESFVYPNESGNYAIDWTIPVIFSEKILALYLYVISSNEYRNDIIYLNKPNLSQIEGNYYTSTRLQNFYSAIAKPGNVIVDTARLVSLLFDSNNNIRFWCSSSYIRPVPYQTFCYVWTMR